MRNLIITSGKPAPGGKYRLKGTVTRGYKACKHLETNGWNVESLWFGVPQPDGRRAFVAICK